MLGPFYNEKTAVATLAKCKDAKLWKKFVPTRDAKKKFSMAFYLHTTEGFLAKYLTMPPQDQMYCEVIPDNVPLKIYMDVEFKRNVAPNVDMDECVALVQQCVATLLKMPNLVPFQLDASNGEKASRHLTWPVALKDKEAVKSLVKHVVYVLKEQGAPTTGDSICGIDLAVYGKNNQGMRMCYSHKPNEILRKLMPYPNKAVNARMAMEQSMIAHFVASLPMLEWNRPLEKKQKKAPAAPGTTKRVKETRDAADLPLDLVLLNQVKDRLHNCYPDVYFAEEKMYDEKIMSLTLRPGVICPAAQRVHESNCTWMNVNIKTRMGEFVCSDPDCKVGGRLVRWGCWKF